MKSRIVIGISYLAIIILLGSCCFGAKEEFLGNNLFLSEYNNVDRKILYQTEKCATSGIEIVPMTVLEIAHNENWIIVKSGNHRKQAGFKYWIVKNDYNELPDSETVKLNTKEFDDRERFVKFIAENGIELELKEIK